ncbi:MAG: pyridoxamine 5'-phosphate oxidase family protein [Clostridiales bacterium]|nr:pyridoxamine 5'-phosphate oxidase family protein [Clostridiales bacterium]
MFRQLTRIKQKLANEECENILTLQTRGVLSVNDENGYPYAMPMNHFYNKEDGCIYFHSGKKGHRTDCIKNNDKACFCVYTSGEKADNEWAYRVKSVIVFGKIEIVEDIDTVIDISKKLCYKFTQDEEYIENEIINHAKNTILLRLKPQHVCGKTVKEE